MADKRIDKATGTETVGHEWDGIEELDTPMPRWWLYTLYATIAWALVYTVLYPAWPLLESATGGVYRWSSRAQHDAEMRSDAEAKKPVMLALAQIPIERLPQDATLMRAAVEGGKAAFKVNCVQCHGSGAAGSKGYPNLNDDDWLWGGDLKTIHQTLVHGIRQPGDKDTRMSQMPAFGRDGLLPAQDIGDVADYVLTLSGSGPVNAGARRGATIFSANCVACHGDKGQGSRTLGAPRLSDKIWLYGGRKEDIVQTVTNARYGIMPAWGQRLDPATVKMLAAYVHSLGGGEAFVPEAPAANGEAKAEAGDKPAPVKQNEAR